MHMGCVGLHRLNVQDAGTPLLPMQLCQQSPDPRRCGFSPPLPLGSDPGPQCLLPAILCWVLCLSIVAGSLRRLVLSLQDLGLQWGWCGESLHVVVDVKNPTRVLQDAAGHGPAFLRAGNQPQVHSVCYVPQLQLEGEGR